jgi:hypothetical protein
MSGCNAGSSNGFNRDVLELAALEIVCASKASTASDSPCKAAS